ncbi:MAG TPA: helix-turn-helix domain-containing protein [Phototrophicaceae bacterium]|jgi:AraC-like DNA-binding protein|nr:helix-turn-helix domain-containing protein [Phototrophicaceae bacterium]
MTYLRFTPASPLNTYINGIYYRDQPMPYPREKILAMPWLNLMINLGGALSAYEVNHTEPFITCTDSWWVGLRTTCHVIDWSPDMQLFVIDFKPGGAYPFLRFPLSELHNQVVSLDLLWGNFATEFRERLYAAPTVEARFALLECLLLERLTLVQHRPIPSGLAAVQYAIERIASEQGALSIRALSDQIGISQKHLIALFKQLVGGTPKELARMFRFHQVIQSLDPTQPIDWTRIAHQALYYDQSHFNKDFESFTGHSPSEYLCLRRQIYAENPHHAPYFRQLITG